ncbi:MAG TPA: phenylalanine--tRNA ligase subunit beta, partial [Planctomycetaceae bacterium]|nr:phenylalanine--tRNA ligase subunit beta [Planctomycetaceae bacterium]
MKISMNWVRDYVSLPDDIDYDKLAYDLTMSTVEVESVERPFAGLSAFMLARVTDVQPHPNADRLVVATCDSGGSSATVVCGG